MSLVTRDEGSKVNSNINVTPMVDVMLVLLIIFMVITPMVQDKVHVNLVTAADATPMPDADHEDQALVAVTRDGRVYLKSDQVSIDDLGSKVNDILQNKPTKIVYLRADARASYGTVMSVIDAVRTAGVDQLGVMTEPQSSMNATPSAPSK
jgi:biopolymer transport protein ExbD/biopolymer transport protein TolR